MHLKIYPDYETLSAHTAKLIISYINQKQDALVCIASGHTPIGVFRQLKNAIEQNNVDLSRCTFLSLDEWLGIDPSDSGSCLSMLQRDCFEPLQIKPEQIQFFNVNADLTKECNRINDLIATRGGLDIMLVGVGTNGHIGMNEPGTSFDSVAHVGELADETKTVGQKYFATKTKLSKGITLGLNHLRQAKLPIIMANGSRKAAILSKALTGNATPQIPVSVVHLIPHAYVMLDQEAASLL
ncbi:MAG TPA: glucosamine-6-phosphate deaminase [Cyclobacteriaceae bacterium]|nr:glucosamine-6-phosphate deaminase [Cyclobacteriaceae bacterium]